MGPGGVGGLGVRVAGGGQGDAQDEAPHAAGEGGGPELEGVAGVQVEDLGVWGVRGLTRPREPWVYTMLARTYINFGILTRNPPQKKKKSHFLLARLDQ